MKLPYVPVLEDAMAAHQIIIRLERGGPRIAVSCTCLERFRRKPIGLASRWTVPEALAAWRRFHATPEDEQGRPCEQAGIPAVPPPPGQGSLRAVHP